MHNFHPADLADRLERLPADAAREMLRRLPPAEGAMILAELDTDKAANLLEGFTGVEIATWLQSLPPHRNADLVFALPVAQRKEVLTALPPEQSTEVAALLRYLPDSAGGIMDNRFIAVRSDRTVEQCLTVLRAGSEQRGGTVLYTTSTGWLISLDIAPPAVVSFLLSCRNPRHFLRNRASRYKRPARDIS